MLYCYLRQLNKSTNLIPIFHNDKSHGLDDDIISQIENELVEVKQQMNKYLEELGL